jgi:hypothetical protein
MSKAYVDTTILTDVLLNVGQQRSAAQRALKKYTETSLPVYAIKEFKAGPLRNFVWFHNKLSLSKTFYGSLDVLQKMSLTPRRYTTATAIQALKTAAFRLSQPLKALTTKYGSEANADSVLRDRFRLSIKSQIFRAWKNRRSVTSNIVHPVSCYLEEGPVETNGIIVLGSTKCELAPECALSHAIKADIDDLKKLREVLKNESSKPENARRAKALREIIRKPRDPITDDVCRSLGDAMFVILAPPDHVILTTNDKDHRPLADALGKIVESP